MTASAGIKVSKLHGKDGDWSLGFSADWMLPDLPGLILYLDKYPAGEYPGWRFRWMKGERQDREGIQQQAGFQMWDEGYLCRAKMAFRLVEKLEGQVFSTRREALQALDAVMLLGEEDVKA